MTPRVAAVWVFVCVMVLLVVALAAVVPWGSTGAATGPITPDATLDFTEAEIALGDRRARLLVVPGLTSTGVSLALTLALGLTPWGARVAEAVARPLGGGSRCARLRHRGARAQVHRSRSGNSTRRT